MCSWAGAKKLRTYLDTAITYVKKARRSTAREVTLFSPPQCALLDAEDEQGSDEEFPEVLAGSERGLLLVRSISGKVVHSQVLAGTSVRVSVIVSSVCQKTEAARPDEVRLMADDCILEHTAKVGHGQSVALGPCKTLELSLALVPGPPITAYSSSGSRIEVLDGVPTRGEDCHFDRDYMFLSLGDFANKTGMHYIMTSNDDRKTPSNKVMWQLDIREAAVVFINFRSEEHLARTKKGLDWLKRDGWEVQPNFQSTSSNGYPNGPYSGPVYAKTVRPQNRQCVVDLMGSAFFEGTYFVFVQMPTVVA